MRLARKFKRILFIFKTSVTRREFEFSSPFLPLATSFLLRETCNHKSLVCIADNTAVQCRLPHTCAFPFLLRPKRAVLRCRELQPVLKKQSFRKILPSQSEITFVVPLALHLYLSGQKIVTSSEFVRRTFRDLQSVGIQTEQFFL